MSLYSDKRFNSTQTYKYYKQYAPNKLPKYIKQTLIDMKGEIDSNITIVGNFCTPLSTMDSSSGKKTNKKTGKLKNTIDHVDLADIYRTFHTITTDYSFFSGAQV